MKNWAVLLKKNWDLAIRNNLILAIAWLLFIPVVRGIANLDAAHSAECLEQSVALVGVFLLTPLAGPEQDKRIWETVVSKQTAYNIILLLRMGMALGCMLTLILLFGAVMAMSGCRFPFVLYAAGTAATAFALGGVGLFTAAISRSTVIGYSAGLGYFLLSLLRVGKNSPVYLFSMSSGISANKVWLLGIGAVCFLGAVFCQWLSEHGRKISIISHRSEMLIL